LALREHLINEQVSLVVMEATGDYWKPFYYLLEDADFEVLLVNARHVKNLPGRKSDVSDAAWLAQLGRTRAGDPTAGEAVGVESVWGAVS
jgi:transposase